MVTLVKNSVSGVTRKLLPIGSQIMVWLSLTLIWNELCTNLLPTVVVSCLAWFGPKSLVTYYDEMHDRENWLTFQRFWARQGLYFHLMIISVALLIITNLAEAKAYLKRYL